MRELLANYVDPRLAFDEVLRESSARRILLFTGKSGSGKTTLLFHCLDKIPSGTPTVKIQLRGSVITVAEVFSRIGGALGWGSLQTFTRLVAAFQEASQVRIDGNWLAGINNHINVALQAPAKTDREQRRAALTDGVFADLSQLGRVILFVFDTYEQATEEMQAWISGPLLSRAAQTPPVRVVIAGIDVPDANNIEWGDCCKLQVLRGVPDAEHWLPIVDSMKSRIAAKDPKSYLEGICGVLEGNPGAIMQYLEALPRDEG